MTFLPATRAEAEARLQAFIPHMGRRYAGERNYDNGPGKHASVSALSPWLRRRLLVESDVAAAALAAHGPEAAEKFVQEVLWRGYFKGWLERRPGIWASYVSGLANDLSTAASNSGLRRALEAAETGTTGLECFDAWTRELIETGYLHNHARMWFASIWIFTLKLPWRLGADFFYRHLLDGDPASNTLSWRWVAGLHTRGKPYEAKAWNIAKFTRERFTPAATDFAAVVQGLEATEPEGLPAATPLRALTPPSAAAPSVLLITEEDCRPADFPLDAFDIRAAATLAASHLRSPRPVSPLVTAFEAGALADAAARSGFAATLLRADDPEALIAWAKQSVATQILTPYIPEGPLRDWLLGAGPRLAGEGLTVCEWRRDWDSAIWPHATAGFFKVKDKMPRILQEAGLG
jgi:hypothetical protein